MFDFGDVQVQTASEQLRFMLAAIPHHTRVMMVLDAARDAARREAQRPP